MKNKNHKNWGLNTRLNHPQKVKVSDSNPPLLAPIYQSVKFVVSSEASYGDQFIYSRVSNPTIRELEQTLADIQSKEDCIVFGSGIAAISCLLLSLLKCGDHVITFRELYKPGRIFIKNILPKYGIESTILKLSETSKIEQSIIQGKTRLIYFESPTNPNLEIADIEKIISVARKYNILVVMDGTFAGIHQHNQYDIDLMVHSLTKFGNGHGDVLAGSIAGKKGILDVIRQMSILLGASLDPHAAFLIERGLKTYLLRYERQTKNAQKIAEFLASRPEVEKVFYPGLETHQGHELAKLQMKEMGAVVSFILKNKDAKEYCHNLKLIQFAVSLGSTETIICPTINFFGDDLTPSEREEMGINQRSVRMSVGLEDSEDLIEDLRLAF